MVDVHVQVFIFVYREKTFRGVRARTIGNESKGSQKVESEWAHPKQKTYKSVSTLVSYSIPRVLRRSP